MRLAGESDPRQCIYLDDSPRNLAPAHDLGMFTILVGQEDHDPTAYRSLRRPHDLTEAMPELWQDNHKELSAF
jgi:FMN phosphatase YigB (HAD superfamily)